jgi:hypothetical protein
MRKLMYLSVCAAFLLSATILQADSLPESVPSDVQTQDTTNEVQGPQAFLASTAVEEPAALRSDWVLTPPSSGAVSCDSDQSVNCITSVDLISFQNSTPGVGQIPSSTYPIARSDIHALSVIRLRN